MTTVKTIALTIWIFVGKVMSLLFNTLSSFAGASQVVLVVKNPPSDAEVRNAGSTLGLGRSPGEGHGNPLQYSWTSLVAQIVQCLPVMQETRVPSLGREDTLEKEMATHSSTLAWKITWTEEPGRLTVHGVTKSWAWLSDFTVTFFLRFAIAFSPRNKHLLKSMAAVTIHSDF